MTGNKTVNVTDVVLKINKTANVTVVGNNTLVNYTIKVNNTSIVNATNVKICDVLPEGLTFVNATEGYSWDASTRVVSWNLTKLDAGNISEYYVIVRTNSTGVKTNRVNVTCDENKTEVSNTTDIDVKAVNLTIVKSTNLTANVNVTQLFEFIFTVTNNGDVTATDVVISDEIMDVFDIIRVNDGGKQDGNKVTWNISKLEVDKPVSVSVIVNATLNGIYKNVAVVNCNENKTNVTSEIPVIVEPVVEFNITKEVSKNIVNVSDNVTFTITVTNLGPSNATNVNITDVLDDAFKFDGKSTTLTCVVSGKTIVWNIDNLTNGSSIKISFNVTLIKTGNFTNVATVNSTENKTGASNKTNVTANPYPSLVNGTNVTVVYGEEIKVPYGSTNATGVSYEIFDEDGNSVVNGTVGPDGVVPVKQLPVGNYTVKWNNTVDGNHTPANNVSSIEILPAPSLVNGTNVTVVYGEEIKVPLLMKSLMRMVMLLLMVLLVLMELYLS